MLQRPNKNARAGLGKAVGLLVCVCLAFGAWPAVMPATARAAEVVLSPSGDATGAADAAAINAAVRDAAPGGAVRLAAGTFYIGGTVYITNSGFTIAGAGADSTSIVSVGGGGEMVFISDAHNVEITGLAFDGNNRAEIDYGIHGHNCEALNIHDNLFTRMRTAGIWFVGNQGVSPDKYGGGVNDSDIVNNRFYSIGPDYGWGVGVRLSWGSSRDRLIGNTIDTTGRGGLVSNDGSKDCVYKDNVVTNCGLATDGGGEGLGLEVWYNCDRSIIEDNTLDHWLSLGGGDYQATRRNTISDHERVKFIGIEAVGTQQTVITDNLVDGGAQIGLSVSNAANKQFIYWANNTVKNCFEWGSQFQGDGGFSVNHNYLYKNQFIDNNVPPAGQNGYTPIYPGDNGYGFRINGSNNHMTFDSNVFSNNGRSGFQFTGGEGNNNIYFTNNVFDHNGYFADGTVSNINKDGYPIWIDTRTWGDYAQNSVDQLYLDATNTASGNARTDAFVKPVSGQNTPSDNQFHNFTGTYDPPATSVICDSEGTAGQGMLFGFNFDRPIQYCLWDFGEGLPSDWMYPTHVYSEPGTYTVSVITWAYDGQASRAEATVTITDPPTAPQTAPAVDSITSGSDSAAVTWKPAPLATGYIITYGDPANPTVVNYPYPNATSYAITGLAKNAPVNVSIRAYNGLGESPAANMTVMAADPPVITNKTAGDGALSLAWTAVNTAVNYTVKYGTEQGVYKMEADAGTGTSRVLTGLTNLTKYFFAVTATIAGGATVTSAEGNATPGLDLPVYLSDLTESNVYGVWNKDTNANGNSLTLLDGTTYAKGIGVVTASNAEYKLNGQFAILDLTFGVDAEDTSYLLSTLNIFHDNVNIIPGNDQLAQTFTLSNDDRTPKHVIVNIAGCDTLRIAVVGTVGSIIDLVDAKLYEYAYVSDMTPVYADSGWGGVHYNQDINGNPIAIRGQTYDKGIWTHATSTIIYDLDARYSRFVADVGIDDDAAGAGGNVRFQVYVDGTLKYDSGPATSVGDVIHADVDVTGGYQLKLIVVPNPSMDSAHSAWADARLYSALRPHTPAPQITGATVLNGAVRLDWIGDPNATGYIVKYGTGSGNYTASLPETADLSGFVTGLTNGAAYYFSVAADYDGVLAPSAEVSAAPAAVITTTLDDKTGSSFFGPAEYPWARYSGVGNQYMGTEADTEVDGTWFYFDFVGTGVQVIGNKDWLYSDVDFYLDGAYVSTADCYNNGKATDQVLFSASGLANGSHTVKGVIMGPNVNNRYGASIDRFVVTTPTSFPPQAGAPGPSAVGKIEIVGAYRDKVNIRWTAPLDDNRVRGYNIYRNGELAGTADYWQSSFTDTPPVDGYYGVCFTYAVKAVDWDGNESPDGATAVITDDRCWNAVSYSHWNQWENNDNFNRTKMWCVTAGGELSFSFTGTSVSVSGQRDVNFGAIDVYVDNSFIETVDCSAPAWYLAGMPLFTVSGLADGSHTLKIVTKDDREVDVDSYWTYPSWQAQPLEYAVTFMSDGAAYSEATAADGSALGAMMPDDPFKDGYDFNGWYTEENGGGTAFTADTPVTGELVVYAYWTAKAADKAALAALIEEVSGLLAGNALDGSTAASVADLTSALDAASAVNNDGAATQGDVDGAYAALSAALAAAQNASASFVCGVKSMAAKIGKPLAIPFEWNGSGAPVFSTSNAAVCGVTQDGILRPLKAGVAVITVTLPGWGKYVFAVTVTA